MLDHALNSLLTLIRQSVPILILIVFLAPFIVADRFSFTVNYFLEQFDNDKDNNTYVDAVLMVMLMNCCNKSLDYVMLMKLTLSEQFMIDKHRNVWSACLVFVMHDEQEN